MSDASACRCGCGHELDGGAERVRRVQALVRDRQVGAWAVLALIVVLDAVAVSCAVLAALSGRDKEAVLRLRLRQ